ncbi:MAG: hypothetical protein ACM3L9_10830 [Deltaproteobacteria bacterium]
MLKSITKPAALILALAAGAIAAAPAEAGGRAKEYFSQTYVLDKPLHGYEGRAGDYYCSYIRIPIHKFVGGRMKVVAWTLQQHCY